VLREPGAPGRSRFVESGERPIVEIEELGILRRRLQPRAIHREQHADGIVR
jgi:hypothetical protein